MIRKIGLGLITAALLGTNYNPASAHPDCEDTGAYCPENENWYGYENYDPGVKKADPAKVNHSSQTVKAIRISAEAYQGRYHLPGWLFEIDKSVVRHPDHLTGRAEGIRVKLDFKKWSFGGQVFKFSASGNGFWARSDTAKMLRENNVAGVIYGNTDLVLEGLTVDVERRFRTDKIVQPYLSAGLGRGELRVHFNGEFIGYAEPFPGFKVPIREPAEDRIKKAIPIVNLEGGFRINLGALYGSVSGYWNTGYGAKLGVGLRY